MLGLGWKEGLKFSVEGSWWEIGYGQGGHPLGFVM